jgi:hypothetical protein
LEADVVLETGFVSVFSWNLLAELAVGRIILARKPSLTGLVAWTSLVRELGRSLAGGAGSEAREDCLRTLVDGVACG